MPLVGQMPAAVLTEQQQQLDARQDNHETTFATKARETLGDAAAAVKSTFQHATEPLTHAQQKKDEKEALQEQQYHEIEEQALTQQHQAALQDPSLHDKTKIHFMMEAKHNANFVPSPNEKMEKPLAESPSMHKSAIKTVKQVFTGPSETDVTQKALLEQHDAALHNPSACDKTKFAFI